MALPPSKSVIAHENSIKHTLKYVSKLLWTRQRLIKGLYKKLVKYKKLSKVSSKVTQHQKKDAKW